MNRNFSFTISQSSEPNRLQIVFNDPSLHDFLQMSRVQRLGGRRDENEVTTHFVFPPEIEDGVREYVAMKEKQFYDEIAALAAASAAYQAYCEAAEKRRQARKAREAISPPKPRKPSVRRSRSRNVGDRWGTSDSEFYRDIGFYPTSEADYENHYGTSDY